MSYRYTERDLLEEPPYHYMFTPFEGDTFLADYVRARVTMTKGWSEVPLPGIKGAARLPRPGNESIETDAVLRQLTDYALGGGDSAAPEFRDWVNSFVRKFETFKRLRRSYDAHFSARDRTPAATSSYTHLAFVTAMAMKNGEELRLLNTLLKLNDHTLSGPVDPDVRGLAYAAVQRELALVTALARRLGVTISEPCPC